LLVKLTVDVEEDIVVVSNNTKLLPETPEGRLVIDAMDLSLHTLIDMLCPH